MPRTRLGSLLQTGSAQIALVSGAGSVSVTFREPFVQTPVLLLVHHLGDESATLTATSPTRTGFTFDVTGSSIPDGDVEFEWVAHEKT